ncbi:MAG: FAD-dependent monooxygenase [Rhodothermales bacterium]
MPKGIIIGGGIGGLATAIVLRQMGHEVEVYERAPEITEVGAGIGLWTNGLEVLQALRVKGYMERSVPTNETSVRSADGTVLSGASKSDLGGKEHDLVRFFHRAELLDCLREALPESVLFLNKQCTSYTEAHDNIAVSFQDGTVARGTYLVGADGIHSAIRKQVLGDEAPRFAGYTAWRAVIPFKGRAKYGEYWGRGARFGIFPLTDNRLYWFATHTEEQGQHAPFGERAYLLELFGRWCSPIADLIEATEEEEILRNDVIDRKPSSKWGEGLVTLLGDAAHPMTPNLGQGACQALEDALAFRDAFAETQYVEEALRNYEKRRRKRANWIVKQSLQVGRIAQSKSGAAIWFRDTLTKYLPDGIRKKQFAKMLRRV